jgi:hypothetical protein
MGKLGLALASALAAQLDAFVRSGGGEYWINWPKPRKACQADMYRIPAVATSTSGSSRLVTMKK